MTYSEQLERETEQTRAAFERTLEELRARITPGQVMDQLVEYARGGTAATFIRNLGQRTVDNPLPLLVIGAGLAWLICANGRATHGEASGPSAGTIADAARSTASRVGETGRSASSAVGDFAQRARSRIAGDRSAPQLGQTEARRSGVADFFQGHPVVLVGLGLAIGAAIGAAITPSGGEPPEEEEAKERVGHMGEATASGRAAQADNGGARQHPGRRNESGGPSRSEGTEAL